MKTFFEKALRFTLKTNANCLIFLISMTLMLAISNEIKAQTITAVPIEDYQPIAKTVEQEIKWSWKNSVGEHFEDVQLRMETYFEGKDKGRGSGYKQWKRWEADIELKLNPDGTIPNYNTRITQELKKMDQNMKKMDQNTKKSLSGNWQNIGPDSWTSSTGGSSPGTGRINRIAFHPTDANTIYIGAARGGLWRTRDLGNNWTPLFQSFANIGISGIEVGNTNPNVVYVLSGDADDSQAASSAGVYKSTDAGETFQAVSLPWGPGASVAAYQLRMDPSNDDHLFVVSNIGLYESIDGGNTWVLRLVGDWRDMKFKVGDPNQYVVGGTDNFAKWNGAVWFSAAFPNSGIRTALATTAANPNVVYALPGNGFNIAGGGTGHAGIWKSTDFGQNWSRQSNTPNIMSYTEDGSLGDDQAGYDIALLADRNNESNILSGGVNVWGSTNDGLTMSNYCHWALGFPPDFSLPYVHADIHALEQNPLDDKVYCATDGGIYVSDDFGLTWKDLSKGVNVGMYYRIDNVEGSERVIMGAQDNGSMFCDNNDGNMVLVWNADGMECKIADDDTNKILFSDQGGGLYRSYNAGVNLDYISPPGSTGGAWTTPVDLDPTNSDRIATAYTNAIYVTTNFGTSWSTISMPGAGQFHSVHFMDNGDLFAATRTQVWFIDSSNNPTDITYNLPFTSNIISALGSHQNVVMNGNTLDVVMGGFEAANKTFALNFSNGSTSWFNYTYTLPNVPIYSIDGHAPSAKIYVGHALGVSIYDIPTGNWSNYSNGIPNQSLPNTEIRDIEVNETNGTIYASAWGRGLFMSELLNTTPPNDLMANAIEIDCYQGYQIGTTTLASATGYLGICGTTNTLNSAGVWYKIKGTGHNMTFSLCGASHDSQISIWEDIAGTLICVDGEDDDTACPVAGDNDPIVTITSGYGKLYYIYAYGYNTSIGDFTIDIECDIPNPPCTEVSYNLSTSDIPTGLYHAIDNINSNADLMNPAAYKAGNYIELNPIFEVDLGITFEAIIEDCL